MDVVICTGPGLVFVVYPAAIAHMPGSPVWAALFFVFLFTVGVDSQVSFSLQIYNNKCDGHDGHGAATDL